VRAEGGLSAPQTPEPAFGGIVYDALFTGRRDEHLPGV
jgi:hypothetical protein